MDETIHQPGKLDFLIEEKDVSVTEFRRRPSAVWAYLETVGHVVFFTRRGKRDCAIMSIETHACLSGDYEKTMREVEEAAAEKDATHLEEECGDLLLAAACAVSHLGVHPELALKAGVDKFIRRFAAMERIAKQEGKVLSASLSDEEYDRLWNAANAGEKSVGRE